VDGHRPPWRGVDCRGAKGDCSGVVVVIEQGLLYSLTYFSNEQVKGQWRKVSGEHDRPAHDRRYPSVCSPGAAKSRDEQAGPSSLTLPACLGAPWWWCVVSGSSRGLCLRPGGSGRFPGAAPLVARSRVLGGRRGRLIRSRARLRMTCRFTCWSMMGYDEQPARRAGGVCRAIHGWS
jgi:hypothetical protein